MENVTAETPRAAPHRRNNDRIGRGHRKAYPYIDLEARDNGEIVELETQSTGCWTLEAKLRVLENELSQVRELRKILEKLNPAAPTFFRSLD